MVMGTIEDLSSAERSDREDFGALVGWTHSPLGDRIVLNLQSTREKKSRLEPADIHDFRYILTRSQAAVLATWLFEISGQTPPQPRRCGLLSRLLRG